MVEARLVPDWCGQESMTDEPRRREPLAALPTPLARRVCPSHASRQHRALFIPLLPSPPFFFHRVRRPAGRNAKIATCASWAITTWMPPPPPRISGYVVRYFGWTSGLRRLFLS